MAETGIKFEKLWKYLMSIGVHETTMKIHKRLYDKNGDGMVSEEEYKTAPWYHSYQKAYDMQKDFKVLKAEIDPVLEQSFGSLFGTITAITDNLKDIWTHANNEFFFALAIIILGVIAVNLFNQFGNYSNMLTKKEESLFDKLKSQVRGLFD